MRSPAVPAPYSRLARAAGARAVACAASSIAVASRWIVCGRQRRRNFDARVQDLERVRAALAAQHVPFAPPEAVAATLVAGFVAFDAGASDATRLESACTLYLGCASNPPSRARGVIQSCVAALERGENVGAGVQGALNALDDPTLLVEVGPRCCAVRNSVIASRVAAAAVRIGGEGPRADACRAAYLHLLASILHQT